MESNPTMTSDNAPGPNRTWLLLAFLTLYLVWGSTFLAIKLAIETMPPFLMAGLRFLLAGSVLYALVGIGRRPQPTRNQWQNAAVIGFAMFGAANGLVCWAEKSVPSGLASLVIATTPLWMVSLETLVFRAAWPTARVIAGLGLGLLGVGVLIGPLAAPTDRINLLGAGAVAGLLFLVCGLVTQPHAGSSQVSIRDGRHADAGWRIVADRRQPTTR